jgi:hypothetical protein
MRELLAIGHTNSDGVLPTKLGPVHAAMVRDKERACLIENPVIWSGSLAPWQGGPKAIEHPQRIQHIQPSGRTPRTSEIQTLDLTRRQYTMLEALQSDPTITLGQMRSKTQHILITKPL